MIARRSLTSIVLSFISLMTMPAAAVDTHALRDACPEVNAGTLSDLPKADDIYPYILAQTEEMRGLVRQTQARLNEMAACANEPNLKAEYAKVPVNCRKHINFLVNQLPLQLRQFRVGLALATAPVITTPDGQVANYNFSQSINVNFERLEAWFGPWPKIPLEHVPMPLEPAELEYAQQVFFEHWGRFIGVNLDPRRVETSQATIARALAANPALQTAASENFRNFRLGQLKTALTAFDLVRPIHYLPQANPTPAEVQGALLKMAALSPLSERRIDRDQTQLRQSLARIQAGEKQWGRQILTIEARDWQAIYAYLRFPALATHVLKQHPEMCGVATRLAPLYSHHADGAAASELIIEGVAVLSLPLKAVAMMTSGVAALTARSDRNLRRRTETAMLSVPDSKSGFAPNIDDVVEAQNQVLIDWINVIPFLSTAVQPQVRP